MSKISTVISEPVAKILKKGTFAFLGTVMKDGSPHVTPTWVDMGENNIILVNTAEGRIKQKNTSRDPRVSISMVDDENPYSMVTIKGRVIEQTTKGADEHIDKLARKYLSIDRYPGHSTQIKRIILKIKPERVFYLAPRYEQYLKKKG